MKFFYNLLKKQCSGGKREIAIRISVGRKADLRLKSRIYVSEDFFEYFIDWAKYNGQRLKTETISKGESLKRRIPIKSYGKIIIRKKIESPEVAYHRKQQQKLQEIEVKIEQLCQDNSVTKEFLQAIIDAYHNPKLPIPSLSTTNSHIKKRSVYQYVNEFIEEKRLTEGTSKGYRVLVRVVARYEEYVRAKGNKDFYFDVTTMQREDIEKFFNYIKKEHVILKKNRELFKRIQKNLPKELKSDRTFINERSNNTLAQFQNKIKSFFHWLLKRGIINKDPICGIETIKEQYGAVVALTKEERNKIADYDLSCNRSLEVQRDIFIFQCLVGCRVSDLSKLTHSNIVGDLLIYTPKKTKNNNKVEKQVMVPLRERAMNLIEKYKDVDTKGCLFPCISDQKYNCAIKEILSIVGINRSVSIRDRNTGKSVFRPICDFASSHLARRTFVSVLFNEKVDSKVISVMSGHTENSTAFARYVHVDNELLKDAVKHLE